MVINIISNSVLSNKVGGPIKVIKNTLLGLDLIGQEYVLNQPLEKHEHNWIQDSVDSFIEAAVKKIKVVAGPNLFTLPSDIPYLLPLIKESTLLFPALWPIDTWKERGFDKCKMEIWPSGIDVEKFLKYNQINKDEILIYFKKRKPELLEKTIALVKKLGLKYNVLKYGSYNEQAYLDILKRSKFGIWIGTTESQGIALLEALASNVPLLVLNSTNILDHETPEIIDLPSDLSKFKATSVPYFDERCGIVINTIDELENSITVLMSRLEQYAPSSYVKENLTLEKSAHSLVKILLELETNDCPQKNTNNLLNNSYIEFIKKIQFARRQFIKLRRKIKNL